MIGQVGRTQHSLLTNIQQTGNQPVQELEITNNIVAIKCKENIMRKIL